MTETHVITITVPSVPHGPVAVPKLTADADYYRRAARNIRNQFANDHAHRFAGSNLTETVAQLCDTVADELEAVRKKRRDEQRAEMVRERGQWKMRQIRSARRGRQR